MKRMKTWLIACALVATPAIAMAEEEGVVDAEVESEVETTTTNPDGSTTTTEVNTEVEVTTTGPAGGSSNPVIFMRSQTVDAGKLQFRADLPILRASFTDPLGNSTSDTSIALAVGAGYGVTDKIEAGLSYALTLEEFEAAGPISAYGRFKILDDAKMQLAASASVTYDIDGETLGVGLGGNFRYRLNDQMGIYTGAMQGTNFAGGLGGTAGLGLSGASFGLPGDQLSIGLDPATTIALAVPVGFEYQAAPQIYVSAQTVIMNLAIKDAGDTTFLFADYIPLALSAFYNAGKIDIGGTLAFPDLPEAADFLVFNVHARYHM